MDYDTLIENIGGFGTYQKLFIFLLSLSSIFNALTTMSLNFIFGEHNHRCSIPDVYGDHYSPPGSVWVNTTGAMQRYNVTECMVEINGTMTECNNWVYDQSVFTATIISKFDIVCHKKFYRAYFLTSHYVGLLVGSIVSGLMCDTFGRKPTLVIAIVSLILAEGLRPLLSNFTLVVCMEFLNGFGTVITYISPFIMVTELVGPEKRLFGSFILYITYCLAFYLLLLLAYTFRNWTHLLWVITVFVSMYIGVLFFITESPRWLLSRGRKKEALVILQKIAEMNKKDGKLLEEEIIVNQDRHVSFVQFLKTMLRSRTLVIRLTIIGFNWFALNMTYYGLAMNVGKLAGDIFVNYTISSSAEVAAILFCWLVTDRIGHKKFYCSLMIIGGVTCMCTIFTTMFGGDSLVWLTTVLAFAGRFFISAAFFVVYLYTAELFPTVLRASALGLSSMCGRIGSIASAYVGELGSVIQTQFGTALPILIFGATGLVAGLLTFLLPDTTNIVLPESVKDAKLLNRKDNNAKQHEHELKKLTENGRAA